MLEIISLLCCIGAIAVLIVLSVIDLKVRLLPNEWVLGFACLGMVFHLATVFIFLPMEDMALGAFIGGSLLYIIRQVANMVYGADALGLGDVKLMTVAGLWLGPYYILVALSLGALAGVLHGLGLALYLWRTEKRFPNMNTLSLPAGPGFAIGIILTAIWMFRTLPAMVL